MNDQLTAIRAFVHVARTGSFSRAASQLGISQPSVSRTIGQLERELGVALIVRTTRSASLTQAGREYLARVEPVLVALEEAKQSVASAGELQGQLRIGLPASIAIREVIPRLPAFLAAHPKLTIDLSMDDKQQNLVRDAIDVAIRIGDLGDSSATCRRIGTNQRLLVASRRYLERAGRLHSPGDLENHAVILGPPGNHQPAWTFERDGRSSTVKVHGALTVNVNEAAVAAAVGGMGIVSCGLWGCRSELETGVLIQVLKEWRMGSVPVHAVFPGGRAAKAAAKSFVDYFEAGLKQDRLDTVKEK
jgi:DNA-binding transcriptional LysR family regulator